MEIPAIETRRLILRAFRDGDAVLLASMMADPETVRYFPFKEPPKPEQVERMVLAQSHHWDKFGHGWWAVEVKEGHEFAGWCGLQYLPDTEEIEVGYLLAKHLWGQGLATEACSTAVRFAFQELGLESLVGIVHPDNVGSKRVLEKVGGVVSRADRYFDMPCIRYVLTREAYDTAPGNTDGQVTRFVPELPDEVSSFGAYIRESTGGQHGQAAGSAALVATAIGARHFEAVYAAARLNASLGRRVKALELLDKAIKAGFWDASRLQRDAAFAHLRHDEALRAMVRGAWANGYIWMLEREERDGFQKPHEVMAALDFQPAETVAEIGPGSGYFTFRVARVAGTVHALDASQEMLEHLSRRILIEGLSNVRLAKIVRDDPSLPDGVDTVLMIDVLHYVADKPAYASELFDQLMPGARVVVIDYVPRSMEERPWGPPPEQQVSREEIDAAMVDAGFVVAESHDFLPEQYFVVYRKP